MMPVLLGMIYRKTPVVVWHGVEHRGVCRRL